MFYIHQLSLTLDKKWPDYIVPNFSLFATCFLRSVALIHTSIHCPAMHCYTSTSPQHRTCHLAASSRQAPRSTPSCSGQYAVVAELRDVTSFLFQPHPVDTVYGGKMSWPMGRAADVIKYWRDFILTEPKDMNGWFASPQSTERPPFRRRFTCRRCAQSCGAVHLMPVEQLDGSEENR